MLKALPLHKSPTMERGCSYAAQRPLQSPSPSATSTAQTRGVESSVSASEAAAASACPSRPCRPLPPAPCRAGSGAGTSLQRQLCASAWSAARARSLLSARGGNVRDATRAGGTGGLAGSARSCARSARTSVSRTRNDVGHSREGLVATMRRFYRIPRPRFTLLGVAGMVERDDVDCRQLVRCWLAL